LGMGSPSFLGYLSVPTLINAMIPLFFSRKTKQRASDGPTGKDYQT
jgi:hypothetical protein